jgi:hypothetical protein
MLSVFENLSSPQVNRIVEAFNNNDQNRDSSSGKSRLFPLLKKWTGKVWTTSKNGLIPVD